MWEPEEQERFETAVVRAMTDQNERSIRRHALALCHVVATPRLLAAAHHLAEAKVFPAVEIQAIEVIAQPLRALVESGERLRGNLLGLEQLLARFVVNSQDHEADVTLDWVDVRDLWALAQATQEPQLRGELERRLARRGKYQRGRLAYLRRAPLVAEAQPSA